MPHQIFYSWQSDTENRIGRGLIQWALDRAIRTVNADADVDPADRELRADRDTVNVPGMPPLAVASVYLLTGSGPDDTFLTGRLRVPPCRVLSRRRWRHTSGAGRLPG